MAIPTIESRRRRRVLLLSPDASAAADFSGALPEGWELFYARHLDEAGDFEDILQFRFVLMDLRPRAEWDPIELVSSMRAQMLLNVPIFCFDGEPTLRDQARLARADRFFERSELLQHLPTFCAALGW